MESIETEVLIVGAGVVGLAIGAELAQRGRSVLVIERHGKFGQETSSRNSEVIHSGIYYPFPSRKTEWCIEGRQRLYAFCEREGVAYAKTGKIVVATTPKEEEKLASIHAHSRDLGVPCEMWSKARLDAAEPEVVATAALHLPETGIVDSHQFMAALERKTLNAGGFVQYGCRFVAGESTEAGARVEVIEGQETSLRIDAKVAINSTGLAAGKVRQGITGNSDWEHRFCRGRYFMLSTKSPFRRLVYPIPPADGLGVHVTLDLAGAARFGPDTDWIHEDTVWNETAYDCDWERLRAPFTESIQRYAPGIKASALEPALIGVRPKLFLHGKANPDFTLLTEGGWIHCLGMESPGLTSALAIADHVASLV